MHSLRPIACFLFPALLVAAPCVFGQTSALPSRQAAGADPAVLRSDSNLVLVDAVVTERGVPVRNLDRSRFHIFEDGREQTIATVEEHSSVEHQPNSATLSTANSEPAQKSAPLPPHTFTNAPQYPPAPAVNVLLLDGLNTPLANQLDVRRQMLEYMGKIEAGTSLAVFTLTSRLRMVSGFTTNPAELIQALKGSKSNPQQSSFLDPQSAQDLDTATSELAINGAQTQAVSAMQQFEADLNAFQTDQRVQLTLDAMQQLALYLSAIPGRKNLIWFSGSFPISLAPDDSLGSPFQAMRNYSDQITETAQLFSSARVAVYPVDARGLLVSPIYNASYSPSSNLVGGGSSAPGRRRRGATSPPANRPDPGKDNQKFTQQLQAEQATMQQIAEQTGGREYINTNGLKEAVADAVENGSDYYSIGYVPSAKNLDGQYRKIQLKVDHADYKLAYRRGYFADDPEQPSKRTSLPAPREASLIMAATLHGAPPSTQILFRAQVLAATDPLLKGSQLPQGQAGELTASLKGPVHRYIVDLRIDTSANHGLRFDLLPDGSHHAKVEYSLVAYDAEGKRINYTDVGLQVSPTPQLFAKIAATGLPARLAIDLPEGQCSLRVAVHDLQTGRAGSLELPLSIPSN